MAPHLGLTFDRFPPTRGSRRALELGLALAEETVDAPRLLLLHGPPGVGKTHLLQAVLNLRAAREPRRSLIRIEAAHLVEQWVASLAGDPEDALPRRLERTDLVAIDDLHTLAGKPVTQREVARTLEGMVSRGGRVVCAMGGSPTELPVLAEALGRLPRASWRPVSLRAVASVRSGLPPGVGEDVALGDGAQVHGPEGDQRLGLP